MFVLLSLFTVVLSGCFGTLELKGDSMTPTLKNGQRVTVDRSAYTRDGPRRGDIVFFEHGGVSRVSRVIGLPGESIRIEGGSVYLNGSRLEEPYLAPGTRTESAISMLQVPDDSYFLLGDNRERSNDSRAIGPIPRAEIVGKIP